MTDATPPNPAPNPGPNPGPMPHDAHVLLGIDTGGTYTDAVVYDERHRRVVAKAKAPTTHHDLGIGIGEAIDRALRGAAVAPDRVDMVSLSTTLATNALVEGRGRPVCAVIIGFDDDVVARGGLRDALAGDPVILLPGGHDPHGGERAPLDLDRLATEVEAVAARVEGFAVMSQFSVRNPAHELAAADVIRVRTGRTVTASHVLAERLNGPARAVTAILNARLVPIIDGLLASTRATLSRQGVEAPVMVVRGDGSLVSAEFVRERPIETILSGPAASLVGAAHLTGIDDAVISDVGGTTTDIAVLRAGVPLVSDLGATVGGHRTMVSAVAMHTHGLGGDSEVRHDDRAAGPSLLIGPRRVVPLAQLARAHPRAVHGILDRQLAADPPSDLDGVFVVTAVDPGAVDSGRARMLAHRDALPEGDAERRVLDRVLAEPEAVLAASTVMTSLAQRRVVDRLVRRGVLQLGGFTPTDANHVLDRQATGDRLAALKGAGLLGRRRDRLGRPVADDATAVARLTIDTLVRRSAEAVLAAAFDHDGLPPETVSSRAVQASLDGHHGVARVEVGLTAPLVGLGASAGSYSPAVAALVRTTSVVPHDADVANAIGAVVGRVRVSHECTVSSPEPGRFVVHAGSGAHPTGSLADAVARATELVTAMVRAELVAAGAGEVELATDWHESTVEVGGTPMFVEGRLRVTGHGRPQL